MPVLWRKRETGFGLLESLVSLSLLTITLAIGTPLLTQAMKSFHLASDAQSIASQLLSAKMKATSQWNQYQMVFDTSQNTWKLQKLVGGSFVDDGPTVTLAPGMTYVSAPTTVPPGAPAHASAMIRFNPRGIPITANGITTGDNAIYLSANGGPLYAVTVSIAGKVKLWAYDGMQWVGQ